ncbi:MAG: MoxR family ATPase [Spirochaetes bacterium]|jgi:MoxR-like ATPase|nr:MoxR family ATPase [Spirochaetota bacterium]
MPGRTKSTVTNEEAATIISAIRDNISSVITGHNEAVDLILSALLVQGHILLEGVPGVAKTLLAKMFAASLGINYSRIQFTPDLMPSDITGTSVFNPKNLEFNFQHGPVFSQLLLIDEINRSPAKTQAALFEAMQEYQVTADGKSYKLPDPFLVIATQNPVEYEGTYRLPEAQLDRFLFKIAVGYPSLDEEIKILSDSHGRGFQSPSDNIKPVATEKQIFKIRDLAAQVTVSEDLIKYTANIIQATRTESSLYLGASPRAGVALLNGAKGYAVLQGRNFVLPDDIQTVLMPALAHRVIVSPESEMEGQTVQDILSIIIKRVSVPK